MSVDNATPQQSSPMPPRPARKLPPIPPGDDPLDIHVELRTMLAMAAGLSARFFESIEPGQDQPRVALAMYAEFVASVDRVYRRFSDPRERRNRKVQPRRVRKSILGPDPLP